MHDIHQFLANAMVEARQHRVREHWETTSHPGWLRRLVGQQMIRFGEWVGGNHQPMVEPLDARAERRIVLS